MPTCETRAAREHDGREAIRRRTTIFFNSGAYQKNKRKKENVSNNSPGVFYAGGGSIFFAVFLGVPSATPPPRALQLDLRRVNERIQK